MTEAKAPKVEEVEEVKPVKKATAKAGKRSAKAVAEVEAKETKEAKKEAVKTEKLEEAKPKTGVKVRSNLERRGKKYQAVVKTIDRSKSYSPTEAIGLAIKTSPTKFDATVEVHFNLNIDPKQADQNIRSTLTLPAGTGKTVKIAVFGDADAVAAAKKAGADIAGSDEFLQQLDKEKYDFDVLIATPDFMPKLGRYAKALGPRGLMPNPKSGTVTKDVTKAINQAKAGQIEYRADSNGIVHSLIGKVSFGEAKLVDNYNAFNQSLLSIRPSSIKGSYIKSIYLTTTMGPSIKIDESAPSN